MPSPSARAFTTVVLTIKDLKSSLPMYKWCNFTQKQSFQLTRKSFNHPPVADEYSAPLNTSEYLDISDIADGWISGPQMPITNSGM